MEEPNVASSAPAMERALQRLLEERLAASRRLMRCQEQLHGARLRLRCGGGWSQLRLLSPVLTDLPSQVCPSRERVYRDTYRGFADIERLSIRRRFPRCFPARAPAAPVAAHGVGTLCCVRSLLACWRTWTRCRWGG